MKKKVWQLSIPIILIAAVVAIGFLMKDGGPDGTSTKIKNTVEKISGLKPWQPSGTLVYELDSQIIYRNLSDDSKEAFKEPTKNISLTSSESGTLLLLEPINQKWNKGKEIADISSFELTADTLPALSPSGDKIAYLSFSNAEKDYGYNIMVVGTSSKSYYSNENQISFLRWSTDSTLVFVVSGSQSSVKSLNVDNGKVEDIAEVKNVVKSLSASSGTVVVTTDASKNNIIAYDIKSKKQTLSKSNKDSHDTIINSDGNLIAYINGDGKIEIYSVKDGNKKLFDKADKLIGWY